MTGELFSYYSAITFFSAFMMVVMLQLVQSNDLLQNQERGGFSLACFLVIVSTFCEWAGVFLDGTPEWTFGIHAAVKVIELTLAPLLPLLLSLLLSENYDETSKKLLAICFAISAVVEGSSAVTGLIFYISSDNVYTHGPLYWIYILTYLIGFFYYVRCVLRQSSRIHGKRRAVPLLLALCLLLSILIQYIEQSVRVDWLCASISVLLLYVFYSELLQQYDGLTHLYNRRSYESRVARVKAPVVLLFLDIDDFKSINDTYGHAAGDRYLIAAGELLSRAYAAKGHCYRIGGDEFCVLLDIPESEIGSAVGHLLALVEQERRTDPKFPVFSIGYACFDPERNRIEDAQREADAMMYHYKKIHKERRSFSSRIQPAAEESAPV